MTTSTERRVNSQRSAEARDAALASGASESSAERLSLFTAKQIANVSRRLSRTAPAAWPMVEGFLAILFTPRCGSTLLAREIGRRYDIGQVGESFNPPRLTGRTAPEVIAAKKGAWFGTKLQTQGLIAAELSGAIDRYLDSMVFVFLLRRDVVAQAVSLFKAKQLQRFHSTGRQKNVDLVYNGAQIGNTVRSIVHATTSFQTILDQVGRPVHRLYYEDAADGNVARLAAVCDGLGIGRVETLAGRNFAELQPIRDAVNAEWGERFRAQIPQKAKAALEIYQALL